MTSTARWDIFCKVIDNYGDVGVCWRLAADLADRGQQVRLWCDDLSALEWLAPQGAPGVKVQRWSDAHWAESTGDVVVEAFGCDPPAAFVQRMAQRRPAPVWINLEYLSAEPWVERCHGLPSPQTVGPGAGLMKWFFYPGFTAQTGGLIRELGLLERQARFDRQAWLRQAGLEPQPGERLAVLFCYANPALPDLLRVLSDQPTLLALTPGPAQSQVHRLSLPCGVRTVDLPWLSQVDFDHLLWSADLNLVRGEDSLVRALWAGRPFLWQLYPQDDGAHWAKSTAFLDKLLAASGDPPHKPSPWAQALRRLWNHWNNAPGEAVDSATGGGNLPKLSWPDVQAWTQAVTTCRASLLRQLDLGSELLQFAARHASGGHDGSTASR